MVANRAAELGPSAFAWWPNWRGQVAAVMASGPSAKSSGFEVLEGRAKVVVIKDTNVLAPWADVCYGCEAPFWQNEEGLPRFKGLKVAAAPELSGQYPDIKIIRYGPQEGDDLLFDEPGLVGAGGNSGFQALNLVAQFGAKKILLVGVDLNGDHWYGRTNARNRSNPGELNFRRWKKAFDGAKPTLDDLGVEVLNASPDSAVEAYEKVTVAEALQRWAV